MFNISNKNIFYFQFEEYQRNLDHSIKRMTKNLQGTRTFWESGINNAIQNKLKIAKVKNTTNFDDAHSPIDSI